MLINQGLVLYENPYVKTLVHWRQINKGQSYIIKSLYSARSNTFIDVPIFIEQMIMNDIL